MSRSPAPLPYEVTIDDFHLGGWGAERELLIDGFADFVGFDSEEAERRYSALCEFEQHDFPNTIWGKWILENAIGSWFFGETPPGFRDQVSFARHEDAALFKLRFG